MNSSTITVHWHDGNQPVYSVDFQPLTEAAGTLYPFRNGEKATKSPRLATGGGDNNVRVWKLIQGEEKVQIQFLSTLRKHTQAVNVVRFNGEGTQLASAGDDGTIIVWKLSPTIVKDFGEDDEDDEVKESWVPEMVLRSSTSEVYDICWSPDDKYLATGSMDHIIRIYDMTNNGNLVHQLNNHTHYIQGIAWDPLNEFLVSQSTDRSVNVYRLQHVTGTLLVNHMNKVAKVEVPASKLSAHPESKFKTSMVYHSETLQSFFRRLTFSPDGSLLLTPSGVYRYDEEGKDRAKSPTKSPQKSDEKGVKEGETISEDVEMAGDSGSPVKSEKDSADKETNTVYIFIRSSLNRPVIHLPGMKKPAIAIAFSPIYYKHTESNPIFNLPYKMVFAVATQDSVIIYDTCNLTPRGLVSNLHYSTITDLKWDKDGKCIIISSADGFCSVINFEDGVFGEPIAPEEVRQLRRPETQEKLKLEKVGQTPVKEDVDMDVDVPQLQPLEIVANGAPVTPQKLGATDTDKSPVRDKEADKETSKETPSIVNLLKGRKKEKKRVAPTLVE